LITIPSGSEAAARAAVSTIRTHREGVNDVIQPRMRLEDAPDVLTVGQLSDVLGIGRTAAYQVIRRGKIRTVRAGRLIKIPKAAIAEILANGATL
jgi:excisionase family DNA binding protein